MSELYVLLNMDHREANLRKKVWKYAAAIQAMAQAGSMTDARRKLGANLDGAIHDGFMDSIATCYIRPFTNNGEGIVGALDNRLIRSIDPSNETTHGMLWQHRMTTAAHSDPRIGLEDSDSLARDLTLLITKLPNQGIQIGHILPCFRIEYEHIDSIIALIANVSELLNEAINKALNDLYFDEANNCMKEPIHSIWASLQIGDTAETPLKLHEAINFRREQGAAGNPLPVE